MAQKHILIVCGEPSGDLQAANLAKAILAINPGLKISAVGGAFLRQVGVEIFYDIKSLSVMGLFDILKKLPKFFALKKLVLEKIKRDKPAAVILVDFSGFNLRLAKAINKSIPVIYYVSPQVWASRPGRVKTIKRFIRKMIVLFKFEEEFYAKLGINADFIGHPLLDIVQPTMDKKEFLDNYDLSESKTTIALLPGSRKAEIKNILPVMLKACAIIRKNKFNTQFIIAKSPNLNLDLYKRQVKGVNLEIKIAEGKTYDCLNSADFSLVCSGTATLEAAIMQKPFALVYKMSFLNYLLYRPQVKLPYIGMVNILAERKIIPEFIQFRGSPKKIAEYAIGILNSPQESERIKFDLSGVKSSLGEKGAASRAARIVIDLLNKD
jgi:lipid-A-disaccharide synthase